jgi:hypothetical protein
MSTSGWDKGTPLRNAHRWCAHSEESFMTGQLFIDHTQLSLFDAKTHKNNF